MNCQNISTSDQGFLYGWGVFTSILVIEGEPDNLEAHIERLHHDCHKLSIRCPALSYELVKDQIDRLAIETERWKLKIIITAGEREGLPNIVFRSEPLPQYKSSVNLLVMQVERSVLLAQSKTLSYVENILWKQYAQHHGCDDALLCNKEGVILETTSSNIYWIHQNTLYYPSFDLPLLKGTALIRLLKTTDLKTVPITQALDTLPTDAVCYTINALQGSVAVNQFTSL